MAVEMPEVRIVQQVAHELQGLAAFDPVRVGHHAFEKTAWHRRIRLGGRWPIMPGLIPLHYCLTARVWCRFFSGSFRRCL